MLGTYELSEEIAKGNAGNKGFLSVVPAPLAFRDASVDLHLGRWFSQPHQAKSTVYDFGKNDKENDFTAKEYYAAFDGYFVLHPGRFVLAITVEWIRLPSDRAAYVTGKSNLGRRGLVIETAPGVHPHFNGCLTLEMANLGEIPLILKPGMKVCQLFLHRTGECPEREGSQFAAQIKPTFGENR